MSCFDSFLADDNSALLAAVKADWMLVSERPTISDPSGSGELKVISARGVGGGRV